MKRGVVLALLLSSSHPSCYEGLFLRFGTPHSAHTDEEEDPVGRCGDQTYFEVEADCYREPEVTEHSRKD